MFNLKDANPTDLDKAIAELHEQLSVLSGDSEEYAKMVDQLVKLYAIKTESGPKRVSPDTWASIIANLLGIIIITGHERAHVVTTKAIGFVRRLS